MAIHLWRNLKAGKKRLALYSGKMQTNMPSRRSEVLVIEEVMRKIWPFYGVMFAVLMLVTYLPTISLWLPHLLGL